MLASTLACATAADTLVTIALCTCRRELYSHRPDGRFADALAFTLAWQLWPTLLSTTVCTCHRDLEISHRPHGRLTFCSLFAGRRCLGRAGWHSDHLIVHDQWEHSKRGAHSCSKFPIAPMGKWLTCLPRLTLAQLRPSLSGQRQWVRATETLKTSHGRLIFRSLFAGRRCLCLFRHGHDNVFLDLREYSLRCA